MKPVTPYQRLLNAVRKFDALVRYPPSILMWSFGKQEIDEEKAWSLHVLRSKVETANVLDHDVHIRYVNGDLHVVYVKRPGEIEYDI